MNDGKIAVVFSAGGMFGAYQAGAWKVLASEIRPDLVVGASIGSLNAWAAAGGCDPGDWVRYWLSFEQASWLRWRWPRSPFGGLIDPAPFEFRIRQIHSRFQPRIDYALVLTEMPALRPRIARGEDVRWEHLAASCAILGLFPPYRIGGKRYTDGGLLGASPVWAAAQLGADRVIELNVMKPVPAIVRTVLRVPRALSPRLPKTPADLRVFPIAPARCLGSARDAVCWRRENIDAWIRQGEQDAARLVGSLRLWLAHE